MHVHQSFIQKKQNKIFFSTPKLDQTGELVQGCTISSVGRVPDSWSQGCRFESCHCCVLEQDTSSSLLNTGSTQEDVPTWLKNWSKASNKTNTNQTCGTYLMIMLFFPQNPRRCNIRHTTPNSSSIRPRPCPMGRLWPPSSPTRPRLSPYSQASINRCRYNNNNNSSSSSNIR